MANRAVVNSPQYSHFWDCPKRGDTQSVLYVSQDSINASNLNIVLGLSSLILNQDSWHQYDTSLIDSKKWCLASKFKFCLEEWRDPLFNWSCWQFSFFSLVSPQSRLMGRRRWLWWRKRGTIMGFPFLQSRFLHGCKMDHTNATIWPNQSRNA